MINRLHLVCYCFDTCQYSCLNDALFCEIILFGLFKALRHYHPHPLSKNQSFFFFRNSSLLGLIIIILFIYRSWIIQFLYGCFNFKHASKSWLTYLYCVHGSYFCLVLFSPFTCTWFRPVSNRPRHNCVLKKIICDVGIPLVLNLPADNEG